MKKKIIIVFIIIILSIVMYGTYFLTDYYPADDTARAYLNGTNNVSVTKINNGLFLDSPGNDTAIIFYPGAKVEYISYLPFLMDLSNNNFDCYLIEMPCNLAIFDTDAADEIIDNTNYNHYFLAGHSLGGAIASEYIYKTNKSDGLLLFESYVTKDIKKPTLSVYGSEDKILDMEEYGKSKSMTGKNLTEVVIIGGNHAQIGNYGNQSNDGAAKISSKQQQELSAKASINFLNKVLE